MKYQKKKLNKKLIIKNTINLIFKQVNILSPKIFAFFIFFSCFIDKICESDKDNLFRIKLITADITVEYKIWGI